MMSMSISLPETLTEFVDARIESGEYSTASEYIAALIRQDQEKQDEQERLEALLLEGLDSPASEMTAADWEDIRRVALARSGSLSVTAPNTTAAVRPGGALGR
jgi:antitoxin ParD1/3/4